MGSNSYKVYLLPAASRHIRKALLKADNMFEIGGLLMGCSVGGSFCIVDVTIPKTINHKSRGTFILNGTEHIALAEEIQKRHIHLVRILGVWHSHVIGGALFSAQDTLSNKQIAQYLDGALSMLIVGSDCYERVMTNIQYITPEGKIQNCNLVDLTKHRKLSN